MKHLKHSMALSSFAATSFLFVPSAFAASSSTAASVPSDIAPMVAVATSAIAVVSCVGWGVKAHEHKRLKEDLCDSRMRADFDAMRNAGLASHVKTGSKDAKSRKAKQDLLGTQGKHCKKSASASAETGDVSSNALAAKVSDGKRDTRSQRVAAAPGATDQSADSVRTTVSGLSDAEYAPRHLAKHLAKHSKRRDSVSTEISQHKGRHIASASSEDDVKSGDTASAAILELLYAVGWGRVESPDALNSLPLEPTTSPSVSVVTSAGDIADEVSSFDIGGIEKSYTLSGEIVQVHYPEDSRSQALKAQQRETPTSDSEKSEHPADTSGSTRSGSPIAHAAALAVLPVI